MRGLLVVFLLALAIPSPVAAAEARCFWMKVGEYWILNTNTGEVEITYYYKYFCMQDEVT